MKLPVPFYSNRARVDPMLPVSWCGCSLYQGHMRTTNHKSPRNKSEGHHTVEQCSASRVRAGRGSGKISLVCGYVRHSYFDMSEPLFAFVSFRFAVRRSWRRREHTVQPYIASLGGKRAPGASDSLSPRIHLLGARFRISLRARAAHSSQRSSRHIREVCFARAGGRDLPSVTAEAGALVFCRGCCLQDRMP